MAPRPNLFVSPGVLSEDSTDLVSGGDAGYAIVHPFSGRWAAWRSLAASALASVVALAAVMASAQSTLYWDTNGTTDGSGAATGTWGTSNFWNTDSTGGAGGAFQTSTTSLDNLFISAGTNAATTTAGTITVSGAQAANAITLQSNSAVTLSGGTSITLGDASTAGAGIFISDGVAAANIVSTPLVLNAHSLFRNAGNAALTISGGVTGAFDLTLNNNVTTRATNTGGGGPSTGITLSTGAINNAGRLINSGNGYGITTISAAIGTNVTEIRQSSNTSQLAISGGITTNSAGTTIRSEGFQALSITTTAIGGSGNLVFTNNSPYSASMGSAWSGSSFVPNGIMVASAVSTTGTITNNGSGNADVQISGIISAASGITQNSAGSNLMLFGVNTYNATTTLASGILGVGNAAALGNAAGSIVFGGGTLQHVNAVTTDFSSRFTATGGNAYKIDTNSLSVAWATGLAATGSSGLTKYGLGTLTLTGTNAFTGDVTIGGGTGTLEPLSGGTLQVGNGTAGSLVGTNNLAFQGTGTFNLQAAAAQSQSMGALTFGAGNGTVQSTFSATSAGITFSSLGGRSTGGTGNFVVSGGTNGSTNSIVLTGAAAGQLLDRGLYFGGSNYAAYDAAGYARAYTTGDADAVSSPAAATLGTVTAASNAFVTGAISAQTTASVNTINIGAANNVAMANGATLSVNGILKSGGNAAVISGGKGLTPVGSGNELVIRTDASGDTLTVTSPLMANGNNALTKSGAGLLKLSGAYGLTGNVAINEGTLQLDSSADVTLGSVVTGAGALAKTGVGRLTLNGTAPSTYTGATVINNSTLVLDYSNMATPTNMLSPVSRITMGSPSATNGATGVATLIIKGKSGAGVVTNQTLSQSAASKTGLLIGNNTARILVDPNGGQETRVLGGWLGNVLTAARDNGNALVIGYANDGTSNPVSASTGGVVFTTDANNNNLPSNGSRIFGRVAWAWNGGVAGTNMDFVVASPVQSNNPMNLYPVGTFGTSYGTYTSTTNDNANHYRITSASGNITNAGGSVNGLKIENPAVGQTLTFTGAFSPNGGIMMTGSNDFTIQGSTISNPTTGGDGSLTVLQYGTGTLTISSIYNRSGNAALVKLGPGRLILSGANTYTGTNPETFLNEGILQAGVAENAGVNGPFGANTTAGSFLFGGGTLQYSAVNNFDYSGRFATSAGQPIKVDTNGRDVTFATILSSAGGTLDKFGAGTLTLSAANTYTGNTTVSGGTLLLNTLGTIAASPTIALGSGATFDVTAKFGTGLTLAAGQELKGDGLASGNFTLGTGSMLTPGMSGVGALKFEGSLTLSPTALFNFELGSPATAGTTYDQIQLLSNTASWNFDLGAGVINFSNFNFTPLTGFGAGTYTLFDSGFGITTQGSLGSALTGQIDGFDATISQSGSNILLTVTSAVPEPGTVVLLISAVGLAAAVSLRRRHR